MRIQNHLFTLVSQEPLWYYESCFQESSSKNPIGKKPCQLYKEINHSPCNHPLALTATACPHTLPDLGFEFLLIKNKCWVRVGHNSFHIREWPHKHCTCSNFTSHVSGRGNIIRPICVFVCLCVCLSICTVSRLNCLTYDPNFGMKVDLDLS